MNKCFLLVSQYRHSYHSFILKVPSDIAIFKSCLLGVVKELEEYKRDKNDTREIHYGDLEYLLDDAKEIFYSYNINDTGDIYIRNGNSVNSLKDQAIYYETKGKEYRKEPDEIFEHHNYDAVYQIVKKYFEVA